MAQAGWVYRWERREGGKGRKGREEGKATLEIIAMAFSHGVLQLFSAKFL